MAVHNKATLMVMAVIAAAIASTSLTDAQNTPSCASKLVPCASFLNTTTKPNAECCNSIKEAVANELPCLCTLYNTPGLLSSFHVSLEDALRLTRDCNVPSDLSSCKRTPGNDGNGATAREAWAGITSLLLFWAASMMLY
ncbi:AAI domain-containing protein [Citrus sinensis]|nr:AAI domain-containing protein [Citrus sinensis]